MGQKDNDTAKTVADWLKEIGYADAHEKDWRDRANKVVDLYRDERDSDSSEVRFNILYANTEVLKGALYSAVPVPDVRRRFLDRDPAGKEGARILGRALSYTLDAYDFDGLMKDVVEDMLLPGRGVARVKYVPTFGMVPVPVEPEGFDELGTPIFPEDTQMGDDGIPVIMQEQVVYEEVQCDYVEWEFFRYSPAKRWSKVRWVAFGELLTRDDLAKQFGSKVAAKVKLTWSPDDDDDKETAHLKRALVWTIWSKKDKKVTVVSDGYPDAPLATLDDPLRLQGFFPCPRPLYDISTTNSLIPVPNYRIYQDHANQLDDLAQRISVMVDAIRRRGVYDASNAALAELARSGDNHFVAIEDWLTFSEKGGLKNAIEEMDITMLAKVIVELRAAAEQKKGDIYEILGISDIMRGTTAASETLGAQEIKDRWGSIRVQQRQAEVQRFARDIIRLKGEIIAEHFSPQTLELMTGLEVSPEVSEILRNDKLRGFRIDIETDSTIRQQANREQKNRVELLTAVNGFLEQGLPAVQQGLIPRKVMTELMMFGVRAFPVGPELEETLDQFAEESGQEQPNQPDPQKDAAAKHQAEMMEIEKQTAIAKMVRERALAYQEITKGEAMLPGNQLDQLRSEAGFGNTPVPGSTAGGMGQPAPQYPPPV